MGIYIYAFYFQFLEFIRNQPAVGKKILMYSVEKTTSEEVTTHLKPNYSVAGSPRRGSEELVMVQFTQFLRHAEGE